MIKTGDREKDYLLYLVRCSLKQETAEMPKQEINTKRLLQLAVKQQVYTVVLPCIENLDLLSAEEQTLWRDQKLSELKKNLIVNSARDSVIEEFENRGIKYMFVKGLVIRDYYPQTLMRQMSDNDILYDASMREELFEVMKEQGFYPSCIHDASDDFFKAPYTLMEMHKKLFTSNGKFTATLDLWKKATPDSEYKFKYNISPDDNYVYSLAHMYKHYTSTGCGIRFLCDMYLLHNSSDVFDFEYINSTLKDLGILDFSKRVMKLVDSIFNDTQSTPEEEQLLTEIFAGGVFGVGKSLQENISESGGKIAYIWRKIFPTKEFMHRNYEVLQKKPYLILFYYIKHFFVRYKNKGTKAKEELKKVMKSQ